MPRGYSLIELAVVIMMIALFGAFAMTSLMGTDEDRDAAMVQTAQVSLQQVVSQGAARLDISPNQLNPGAVLMAVQATVNQSGEANNGVTFELDGSGYKINISSSGRGASFSIGENGDVECSQAIEFSKYTCADGIISKR